MKSLVKLMVFLVLATSSLAAEINGDAYVCKFTSLKDEDCKKLSDKQSSYFDDRKLTRSECPAPIGWQLFTVIGGERCWLEIMHGTSLWSTEDKVVTEKENRFGHFQSIELEKVEWRMSKSGIPSALIFHVVAQDPERYDQNLYKFFVIKLTDHIPRFCGASKSNQKARSLADKPAECFPLLPKRKLSITN
jgi:hypothetical protein